MAAISESHACIDCGRYFGCCDVITLKSYEDDSNTDYLYLCKKCDEKPAAKRHKKAKLYNWECFLCGCLMDDNFFAHDECANVCFECLGIKPSDKIWKDDNDIEIESYDVAIDMAELSADDPWIAQFNKLRADAVIRKQKRDSRMKQRKTMTYNKIAETFVEWMPNLDITDARDLASCVDIERSLIPSIIVNEYDFMEWILFSIKIKK